MGEQPHPCALLTHSDTERRRRPQISPDPLSRPNLHPHPRSGSPPSTLQASVRAAAAADRPLWFPGNPAPAYLDGTLPGDYGFDPLRLGSDPKALKWFQMAEVFHGRIAMVSDSGEEGGEGGRGAGWGRV